MIKIIIPENWVEKCPAFCLFMRDPAHITHIEYPWSPYYKSTLRFLLSEYLLQVSKFINFSKYSHIQKYRTQDHGAGGRPTGRLTTIHTNIPAITINLLYMGLKWVSKILHVLQIEKDVRLLCRGKHCCPLNSNI